MHYQLPECKEKYCPHCNDKLIKAQNLTTVVKNPLKVGDQVYKRREFNEYFDEKKQLEENKNTEQNEENYLKSYTVDKLCEDPNKYWVSGNIYDYTDLVVIPTPKFKVNDIVQLKINYNKWRIICLCDSDSNRLDSHYKDYFLESVDDTTLRITAYEYELELYTQPKKKFPWNLLNIISKIQIS